MTRKMGDSGWGIGDGGRIETARPSYRFGTHRAVPPAATLRRIRPLLPRAGITRLADITGLDWVGIPVYQAVRPNSRNMSVALGKGLTRDQAKVSALMEALEGFHAEELVYPKVQASVKEMRGQLQYDLYALQVVSAPSGAPRDLSYDPYAPPVGASPYLQEDTLVDWIPATNLWTGAATWVPRQVCELNFCVVERLHVPLFRATSNGLASGNTMAEAIVHGLCEVVERDSTYRCPGARYDADRCVVPATISSGLVRRVLDRFEHGGLRTLIIDETGPTAIPCFEVFLDHPESAASYHGLGCHPSPITALLRALTEAAQSRLAHIAGSRDDLFRRTYRVPGSVPEAPRPVPAPVEPRRDFSRVPRMAITEQNTLIREIARRVRDLTGMAPLAVDLSRSDFDLPVVFVVAPGLQVHLPKRR